MKNILAFLFGALFSIGLLISGMANPQKVFGFLDLLGNWDASLAFVMMGAILVAVIPFQKAVRQTNAKTLDGENIQLPQKTQIDYPLIFGSFIFGIGWAIAGICPAPSLVLIGLGHWQTLYFIVAMLIGMALVNQWEKIKK